MNVPDRKTLETAQQDFERDGVFCLRGVVDQQWIEQLREGVEQARTDLSEFAVDLTAASPDDKRDEDADGPAFWGDFSLWQRHDVFRRFFAETPIGAIVADAVGVNTIKLFYDYLLVKEARSATRTPWHQDFPYYPVRGEEICSMWIALDRTTLANGGLEYVAGSHKWGMRLDRKSFGGVKSTFNEEEQAEIEAFEASVEALPDIEAERAEHQILSWDLEPGDVIIHHAMAVHGAPANTGTQPRRGYAIRWMYDDIVYDPRTNPSRHLKSIIEGGVPKVLAGEVIRGTNFPEFTAA